VFQQEYSIAEQLLADNPDLILWHNGLGETPLHYLAVENDLKGVAWLHKKGSSLDVKNIFGEPVIFEVALLGYKELLVWFFEQGADFKVKDNDDNDLISYLQERDKLDMIKFIITDAHLTST